MRRGVSALLAALALGGLCACPPPEDELSAERVAAAFGLVDGRVLHFAVEQGGSTTEDHSFARSSSYAERYVVTRTEKTQGFIRVSADGTAAVTDFEATADATEDTGAVLMVARGDCLPRCLDYAPPVQVVAFPWTSGARLETSSTATVHEGEQTSTVEERHVFTVGAEGQLTTAAGDFDVFELSWQRFVDGGEAEYATLYLSNEVGLIGLDRFDGASLRLTSQEH